MEQYTWKFIYLDQNWADHAVAYLCWDMVMNQWSNCFIYSIKFLFYHIIFSIESILHKKALLDSLKLFFTPS